MYIYTGITSNVNLQKYYFKCKLTYRVTSNVVIAPSKHGKSIITAVYTSIHHHLAIRRVLVTCILKQPDNHDFTLFTIKLASCHECCLASTFQRSVIMVDLLGLDKLASSMALTMVAQAAGILLGPTISGIMLSMGVLTHVKS